MPKQIDFTAKTYYTISMKNWSVDVEKFKKYPDQYRFWRLEQIINFGMDGKKISLVELKNVWPEIENDLEPYKKRFLEYLIWGKVYSLPDNLTFWNLTVRPLFRLAKTVMII